MADKKRIIPCAGILVYRGDAVLLVKHDEKSNNPIGSYGLPSGQIKPGESAVQTAVRKLEEETGLRTTQEDLVEMPVIYKAVIEGEIKTLSLKLVEVVNGNVEPHVKLDQPIPPLLAAPICQLAFPLASEVST